MHYRQRYTQRHCAFGGTSVVSAKFKVMPRSVFPIDHRQIRADFSLRSRGLDRWAPTAQTAGSYDPLGCHRSCPDSRLPRGFGLPFGVVINSRLGVAARLEGDKGDRFT